MRSHTKVFIFLGGVNAALAVMLGAVAAHSLKPILSEKMMTTFQTGTKYHFYHAIGLFVVAFVSTMLPESKLVKVSGWMMLAGIILFSIGLYVLALSGVHWFGVLTPIGGLSFISAWSLLAAAVIKNRKP